MEQRRALPRGTVSPVLVTGDGDTHTPVISAVKHLGYVHVYEVVGALKLEGVGAERHFETTALMR